MKTTIVVLMLVITLFVFQASSALDCSYFIERACWYGNTKSISKQKKCEDDALPLCKEDKPCEGCKKACNEGDNSILFG